MDIVFWSVPTSPDGRVFQDFLKKYCKTFCWWWSRCKGSPGVHGREEEGAFWPWGQNHHYTHLHTAQKGCVAMAICFLSLFVFFFKLKILVDKAETKFRTTHPEGHFHHHYNPITFTTTPSPSAVRWSTTCSSCSAGAASAKGPGLSLLKYCCYQEGGEEYFLLWFKAECNHGFMEGNGNVIMSPWSYFHPIALSSPSLFAFFALFAPQYSLLYCQCDIDYAPIISDLFVTHNLNHHHNQHRQSHHHRVPFPLCA